MAVHRDNGHQPPGRTNWNSGAPLPEHGDDEVSRLYLEDHGSGDGDIRITVEGAEYTAEANYDLDGDGVDETVAIMTDEGFIAYVDEDADGRADVMQTVNSDGVVTDQARFDADTGDWVAEQPRQHAVDPHQQDGDSMVVHTPDGARAVGPATEDTNHDGQADTAIVPTENGTMLATDVDGDGSADQLVEITDAGRVTVSQHSGDGEWTVVRHGELDSDGQFTPNSADATDDATWDLDPPPEEKLSAEQPTASSEQSSSALTRDTESPNAGKQAGSGGSAAGSGATTESGPDAPDSDAVWS